MSYEINSTINRIITEHFLDGYVKIEEGDASSSSTLTPYKRNEDLLIFVCAMCGLEFEAEIDYDQHLQHVHAGLNMAKDLKMLILTDTDAECLICGAFVTNKKLHDLQTHHFSHLKHKPFKCKCHGYYFQERILFTAHINYRRSRLSSNLAASTSTTDTTNPMSYNDSKQAADNLAYENDRPEMQIGYVCSECGEHMENEESWKRHCNQAHDFKTMEGLNMTRFDVDSVRCNECSTIISGKWDNYKLRRHKLTHSPFKAFYCRICKYSRKRKDDVLHHIRQSHVPYNQKYT